MSFIKWSFSLPQLYGAATPTRLEIALPVINELCKSFKEFSKSWRASKLHHWFKSNGLFSERVDFAFWLGCIRKGLRLKPTQSSYLRIKANILYFVLLLIHTSINTISMFLYYFFFLNEEKETKACFSFYWKMLLNISLPTYLVSPNNETSFL